MGKKNRLPNQTNRNAAKPNAQPAQKSSTKSMEPTTQPPNNQPTATTGENVPPPVAQPPANSSTVLDPVKEDAQGVPTPAEQGEASQQGAAGPASNLGGEDDQDDDELDGGEEDQDDDDDDFELDEDDELDEEKEGHFRYEGGLYYFSLPKVRIPGIGERTSAEVCVDPDSQKYLVANCIGTILQLVEE